MARRKARRGVTRKAQAKRPRRPAKRKAPARSGGSSAALAGARARIDELEAENRRLRRELATARGEPMDDLGGDGNDAPLAPGM